MDSVEFVAFYCALSNNFYVAFPVEVVTITTLCQVIFLSLFQLNLSLFAMALTKDRARAEHKEHKGH